MEPDDATKRDSPTRTRVWEKAFLATLEKTGSPSDASDAAEISRSQAFRVRKEDPDFADAWEHALGRYGDLLAKEADRRARKGVLEPVVGRIGKDKDGIICKVRKFSDSLLALRLKRLDAGYRDRHEVTGKDGGPLVMTFADLAKKAADPPSIGGDDGPPAPMPAEGLA